MCKEGTIARLKKVTVYDSASLLDLERRAQLSMAELDENKKAKFSNFDALLQKWPFNNGRGSIHYKHQKNQLDVSEIHRRGYHSPDIRVFVLQKNFA